MNGVGGPQMPVEPIVRATIRAGDTLDADDAQVKVDDDGGGGRCGGDERSREIKQKLNLGRVRRHGSGKAKGDSGRKGPVWLWRLWMHQAGCLVDGVSRLPVHCLTRPLAC